MKAIKSFLVACYRKIDSKFLTQFGSDIKNVSFNKIVDYMYAPKDSSSLAVTRIFFGLAMLFDIPDERGGASMVRRWGDVRTCHFPLLPWVQPVPLPYMAVVYAAMWFGALGMMLGYKFRITAPLFTACYWYLFLIEKSLLNNHSYLFGLVALLLSCTDADCYWSIDSYLDPSKQKTTVPYWNYFLLKYQFFILYFMAGMKKGTAEWLTGYSVQNLSEHWVFDPFKYFLTVPQTDYLVVHWFVFMFDLTVALWMMWSYTRHVAMVFCALFHLMNSRLFRIGMFPWVCLATMPLFYPFDWPKRIINYFQDYRQSVKNLACKKINIFKNKHGNYKDDDNNEQLTDNNTTKSNENTEKQIMDVTEQTAPNENIIQESELISKKDEDNAPRDNNCDAIESKKHHDDYKKKKMTIYLIGVYVFLQAFLPFSHFITKGYNNWTNGLYGYSWDMMVHTWDSSSVTVKIVDNNSHEELFIDPEIYTLNDRWSRHGDMVYQYAKCLKKNLKIDAETSDFNNPLRRLSDNISIYVDIWCSMNGRFSQRMFDSKVDLLQVEWSPFNKVSYLMPLLDEAIHWRKDLDKIRDDVHSWSEYSDVVFYADFPGYEQEKYIPVDLQNITLRVLEGIIAYEPAAASNEIGKSYKLQNGQVIEINPGTYHKVLNIGQNPAFYMYQFYNGTQMRMKEIVGLPRPKLPIFRELFTRFKNMIVFGKLVITYLVKLFTFSNCV